MNPQLIGGRSYEIRCRPHGELLEDRRLLTVAAFAEQAAVDFQHQTVDTGGNADVQVDEVAGAVTSTLPDIQTLTLNLNSPLPITEFVTVQPIIVANDDGSNSSEYFGTASQQADVHQLIDDIWAQAGIDIVWLGPRYWNNTFANIGNNPAGTRSSSDLGTIRSQGDAAGVGNSDPLVLDMYFVEISPGFTNLSENYANGLAYVAGNGITVHIGDNLLGWTSGREVVARVVAHEIGHNLGLGHVSDTGNLMGNGSMLNASQINTALNIQFSVPVPLNTSPSLINPLADVTVDENAAETVIDLANVFADAQDTSLNLSVTSTNSRLVNASIDGTSLILNYIADAHGTATITVTATDSGGLAASDSFDVIVNEVLPAPGVFGSFVGAPASGVRVSAVDATGTTFWTTADSFGEYNLPLAPGDYFVTANGGQLEHPILVSSISIGSTGVEVNFDAANTALNGQDISGVTANGEFWVGESTGNSLRTVYYGSRGATVGFRQLGAADMNGDGLDDLVSRAETGELVVSLSMANSSFRSQAWGTFTANTTWSEMHLGDFNGDGMMDVLGRADSDGSFWLAASTGNSFATSYWGRFSTSVNWSDMQAGDFNGDGNTDLVARAQDGTWWVAISNGVSRLNNSYWGRWSTAVTWSDVMVGDFNGDGRDDIAGRANNAYWWVNRSSGSNYFLAEYWGAWGQSANWLDVLVGDFDGDGDDDVAGRASGQWWIAKSNGSRFANEYWGAWSTAVAWSNVSTIDLNDDGRSDVIGRAQNGEWWLLESTGTVFRGAYLASWSSVITWQSVLVGNFV